MQELEGVFVEALKKFKKGESKYGRFVPETDSRDLLHEAESELLDAINYAAMLILKIRQVGR